MTSAIINGVNIEYEVRGSGPWLLAVMGLGGQLTDWPGEFIDMLAKDFTVVTFDNRDIGLSQEFTSKPPSRWQFLRARFTRYVLPSEYTLSDMAGDAAGLLDHLGASTAHVMGMSMGGMIVQTMAIEHPERLLSMTSVMSNTGDDKNGTPDPKLLLKLTMAKAPAREDAPEILTEQYALFAGSSWSAEEHLRRTRLSVARSWRPQSTERQMTAIAASPDRTAALGNVTVPSLVVHGLEDTLVRPSGGIATAQAIPGSRLLMFPDMGHDFPSTRWREIADAVLLNTQRVVTV